MQAGSLNCPQCGAAVAQDATQCQYCHTLLQTVACPKCLGMIFLGSKFCPHCGAAIAQAAVQGVTAHTCPRCRVALDRISVANTDLDQCPHCGGLWIALADFDRLCSDAESRTAATGLKLPPPVPIDPKVHYLHCPQCAGMMGRINYSGHSGIVLNVCRPHGFWLDRDQMQQVVNFISTGGLDRAREREIEQLQRERKALEGERRIPDMRDLSGLD
jgi:Zn-finger nucleic acid-binding protein